ncbi:hypothetical protein M3G91_19500 [Micromonospora chalcea]|uniref:hypothetical protein n=1 Tax=Micromonospora chalcea TaxID=1874 RepID=UPI0021A2E7DC|nr:hypothetical protein [Micromonospora chalcea]MCT2279802.1 hypothetical protein [Micromonospora chalcea]
MPASVAPADKRNPTPLTVLFWIGVGLAPLAALILLIADGNGSLRFGAVLAILAVVLIGLSIALRPEGGSGGAASEELREELEQLRRELRAEIVAAAQRGNQALDQARRAEEVAGAVRHRLDAAAAGLASAPAPERPSGAARVPAAGAYEADRGHPAGRDEDEPARPAYSGGRYSGEPDGDAPRAGRHDAEPARAAVRPPDRPASGVYGSARVSEPAARPEESRPVGVVHHTETVHVTTRHTIVGGGAEPTGARYGGFPGGWSGDDRSRGGDPADHRGAGHRERDRADRADAGWTGTDDSGWGALADGERSGHGRRDGGSRDGGFRPGDGHSPADAGRAGAEHPWAGVGGEQGWSAGGRWSNDPGRAAAQEQRQWSGDAPAGWAPGGATDAPAWSPAARHSEPAAPGALEAPAGRDPADGDHWSELRAGNRWAAVRDDDAGREIRLGERRAAVHADSAGTEYRVEDRWASVRGGRADAGGPGDGRRAGESHPALPAGGVPVPDEWRPPTQRSGQPEWRQPPPEWRQPEPERREPEPQWRPAEPQWRPAEPQWRPAESQRREPEPDWRQPEPEWRQGESQWRPAEPQWRQGESSWRQPEPEWRQPEPDWRGPERGGHGQPQWDTADRWR